MRGARQLVARVVRATEQTGELEKAWSKVMPCFARASMLGALAPPGKKWSR